MIYFPCLLSGLRSPIDGAISSCYIADKAESAAAVAQKLISWNQRLALIGPNASGNALPAARICEDAGVIMISPWSTNPKTTEGKKYVFRACFFLVSYTMTGMALRAISYNRTIAAPLGVPVNRMISLNF